jgi:hypothetical protein
LTPSLEPGAIQGTADGFAWWQRYTYVGVPQDFPDGRDASERVMCGTVAALKAIRPDLATTIDDAERMVRAHGDELRFLLKTRQAKRFIVDISFNIAVWPQPSRLFVSLPTGPAAHSSRRRRSQYDSTSRHSILPAPSRSLKRLQPYCRTNRWPAG